MGSVISVRRGSRYSGLGRTRRRRRGMRGLGANRWLESALPPLVGGGVAAATVVAIRQFVNPMAGRTQHMLVKWAPLLGGLAGGIASIGLWLVGGAPTATSGFLAAGTVAGFGLASDMVLKGRAAQIQYAIANGATSMAAPAPALAEGAPATGPQAGIGAIVPEYGPTGAIVMEPTASRGYGSGLGSYGDVVNLGNVNAAVFGTPGF